MAYNALNAMREQNLQRYGLRDTVKVPPLPAVRQSYGREALAFLRDCCENLKFDNTGDRAALLDSDGRSAGPGQIPYNMERDLDRLSFETAAGRFLNSGSREDAFDIYYCYCEIFKPFGTGYGSTGLLLELLSEHESNASSLLMKHRDHYSHSVYVFLIGLAIYKNHAAFRKAYNEKYGLAEGPAAACHFLEYWGLSSLFHDVGYPFEIAHQQMKAYVCKLDKNNNDDFGFSPYVSYRNMDEFTVSRLGDLNDLYARLITERLAPSYLLRTDTEAYYAEHTLKKALKDRGIHENPSEKDYLYMDHAYFSGLVLMKTYLRARKDITKAEELPPAAADALTAIILHNSLFKFTIRAFLHTKEPLRLSDGQPLSYLLMFCDELQCWDRTSYGQNSRGGIFACDFDMTFTENGPRFCYCFDRAYEEKARASKAYKDLLPEGYTKKSGAVRKDRSKFLDDIDEIVRVQDLIFSFEPDLKLPDRSGAIDVVLTDKQKRTGLYLSDSSYLNLYRFALALNGRYAGATTEQEMRRAFEEDLSLEYKLSNIAEAKGFSARMHKIGCFYTDRAVDFEPVLSFTDLIRTPGHENDLNILGADEHGRWCAEKEGMGWQPGTAHVKALITPEGNRKNDNVMRDRTRMHHDFVPWHDLTEEEKLQDLKPMELLLKLIREFEGLTIYRML